MITCKYSLLCFYYVKFVSNYVYTQQRPADVYSSKMAIHTKPSISHIASMLFTKNGTKRRK